MNRTRMGFHCICPTICVRFLMCLIARIRQNWLLGAWTGKTPTDHQNWCTGAVHSLKHLN